MHAFPRFVALAMLVLAATFDTEGAASARLGARSPAASDVATRAAPATATAGAVRVRPQSAFDVVVVGDSLTFIARDRLVVAMESNGWHPLVDGRSSRSISYPADVAYSAVDAVAAIKASGVDPLNWVVALGTNDLYFIVNCRCPDLRSAALERIRLMLAAIGPGHRVVWVGVQNYNFPEATSLFNDVLDEVAGAGEISELVDWASISGIGRSAYFVDDAHLSDAGYALWVRAMADALGLQAAVPDPAQPR